LRISCPSHPLGICPQAIHINAADLCNIALFEGLTFQSRLTSYRDKALAGFVAPVGVAGDNAWMLTSAALVLLMTGPGLALFYGGLVRKKNILGTMMQSFAMMGLVTVSGPSSATRWPSATATLHRRLRAPLPARRRPRAQSRLRDPPFPSRPT
jgi:hypothetical protein